MKSNVQNFSFLMQHVRRGQFCDTGHYYCPRVREDGSLVFPSGVVRPDGSFKGAKMLLEHIEGVLKEGLPVFGGSFSRQPEDCPATNIVLV